MYIFSPYIPVIVSIIPTRAAVDNTVVTRALKSISKYSFDILDLM